MPTPTDQFKESLDIAFASIEPGKTFTWRRTFTDGDVSLFCGVTGDFNPYHQDDAFVADSWFGRRIVPGMLTVSMVTHIGGMIGFLATEMHFEFLKPVFVGDTVTCVVTFVEKNPEKRRLSARAELTNLSGEQVARATFAGIPSKVRLA